MPSVAAPSKERSAGFGTKWLSSARTYSANAPSHQPHTSSPGRKRVTFAPTASTTPAASVPRIGFVGARIPFPMIRTMNGLARMMCQSCGLTEAARTRTSTSSSPTAGRSISLSSRTSAEP